ncbi:unnamed protein product [Pleuronectes platessa]|uniref:Uncharacterized protein n=1 Tax=Pleuronectes platessa TaxID=8262 RepID=A0A9N7YQ47_PLEPL|nr:unnamed protein product [Pleuronectes platessa]
MGAEAENLPPRRQTCREHLLGSLPLFLSLLPSLHPSLAAPLLNLIETLPNHSSDSSGARQTLPQVLVYLAYSNVPSLCYTGCGSKPANAVTVKNPSTHTEPPQSPNHSKWKPRQNEAGCQELSELAAAVSMVHFNPDPAPGLCYLFLSPLSPQRTFSFFCHARNTRLPVESKQFSQLKVSTIQAAASAAKIS